MVVTDIRNPNNHDADTSANLNRRGLRTRSTSRAFHLAAALLVGITALLAVPGTARAIELVSTIGQTQSSAPQLGGNEMAQGFMTGDHTDGYILGSIDIDFSGLPVSADRNRLTVELWSATNSNVPDALLATLSNPSDLSTLDTERIKRFTAPANTSLSAETEYFLYLKYTGSSSVFVDATTSNSEDSGSASGWTINNDRLFRTRGSSNAWTTLTNTQKIRIHGTLVGVSSDANLSDLELKDGSTDIDLSPSFASATTAYTATVDNDVDQVTILPSASDDGATISFLDEANAELTDADAVEDDFQVNLVEGSNTIRVRVIAEDTTRKTYSLTVARAPGAPTDCETDDIWCASVLVANAGGGYGYCSDANIANCEYGLISDDDFVLAGTNYLVESVRWAGNTHLTLDRDFPATALASLTLVVHGEEFALSDAARSNTDGDLGNNYRWSTSSTVIDDIAVGDVVTVRLIQGEVSSDSTLSALALKDGSTDIDLSPTFSDATTDYTASVGHDVEQVTIIPAVTATTSSFEIQDSDGTALTDSDSVADEVQVDLDVGPNTIKVQVTAQDSSTETYTLVVTRALGVSIMDAQASEADGFVRFTIAHNRPLLGALNAFSLSVSTANLTATAGADYTAISGQIVQFSVGDVSKTVTVTLSEDDIAEIDETFNVTLSRMSGDIEFADDTAIGTIQDNDTAGVSVSKMTLPLTEGDTTGDTYTVVLASEPTANVVIEVGGTTGSDLTANPSSLTFTPANWDTTQTVTVTAASDADRVDDTETLTQSATSTDSMYSGITIGSVEVTVTDNTAPASDDPSLSNLELTDGTNEIDLIPSTTPFNAIQLTYRAHVSNDTDQVTIIPTTNHTGAMFAILDGSDTTLTDADTGTEDFQVDLDLGRNTIKVKVTAEDMIAERTYTLTLRRSAAAVGCESDDILCAALTVETIRVFGSVVGFGYFPGTREGAIFPSAFSYDSTNYRISGLDVDQRTDPATAILNIELNPAGATVFNDDDFILYADGEPFRFGDAEYALGDGFSWLNTGLHWSANDAVTIRLVESPNNPPGGAPAITGDAKVGEELTATTDAITDTDGTTRAVNGDAGYAFS